MQNTKTLTEKCIFKLSIDKNICLRSFPVDELKTSSVFESVFEDEFSLAQKTHTIDCSHLVFFFCEIDF